MFMRREKESKEIIIEQMGYYYLAIFIYAVVMVSLLGIMIYK